MCFGLVTNIGSPLLALLRLFARKKYCSFTQYAVSYGKFFFVMLMNVYVYA